MMTMGWKRLRAWWTTCVCLGLVACGGGSSADAGSSLYDGGSSSSGSYTLSVAVAVSGSQVTSLSASATAQVQATVTNSSGEPVSGVLVTFTDSVGLLTYSPAAATALTDADGVASIDVTPSATGATVITASSTISDTDYAGTASLAITASATTTATPAAINFISVSPSTQSIVIKGAGGNGRVETAILKFQVLDSTGAAVSGTRINFSASPTNAVTLNVASAVSDSSGYVSTTVQSGSTATTVVITATSAVVSSVSGKSDTLTISTGSIYQAGFGIYAAKYNLDGTLVGDSTTLTAYLTDANGNPVADGVAVSFTTNYGAVASSDVGGCTTSNGTCAVTFKVAPPFGDGLATVVATANDGSDTINSSLRINMAGVSGGLAAYGSQTAVADGTEPTTGWTLNGCADVLDLYLMDAAGRSAAAGTLIAVANQTPTDLTTSITNGATVLDATDFTPTQFTLSVDATSSTLKPCKANGTTALAGYVRLSFTTPASGAVYSQRINLYYPQ